MINRNSNNRTFKNYFTIVGLASMRWSSQAQVTLQKKGPEKLRSFFEKILPERYKDERD